MRNVAVGVRRLMFGLAVMLFLGFLASQGFADEADAALRRFEASLLEADSLVRDFHVEYTAHGTFSNPKSLYPELTVSGELTHTTGKSLFRLISKDSRSGEVLKGYTVGWNGERSVRLVPEIKEAHIDSEPHSWTYSQPHLYLDDVRVMGYGNPRSDWILESEVSDVRLEDGLLTFKVGPHRGAPVSLEVEVDASNNTVRRVDVYDTAGLWMRLEYSDFRDIGGGLLFPFAQRHWSFSHPGRPTRFDEQAPHLRLDFEVLEASMNNDPAESLFEPEIPTDYAVFDNTHGVRTVGALTDETVSRLVDTVIEVDVENLFEEVQESRPGDEEGDSGPSEPENALVPAAPVRPSRTLPYILGAVALLVAAAVVVFWLRRKPA